MILQRIWYSFISQFLLRKMIAVNFQLAIFSNGSYGFMEQEPVEEICKCLSVSTEATYIMENAYKMDSESS